MKKLYNESYFDRKNWILENFSKLGLSTNEAMLLLIIDLAYKKNENLNNEYFSKKLSLDSKSVDNIVASLVEKKYLKITPDSKGNIVFNFDAIFEFDPTKYDIEENKDMFAVYEDLVSRPLTDTELQKLSDLVNEFDSNKVKDALRIAESYRKISLAYVETILRNEKGQF